MSPQHSHELNVREFHLIETMRREVCGVIKSLDAHLERAARSATYLGFSYNPNSIREALADRARERPAPARIRLLLYRNGDFAVDVSTLPVASLRPLTLAVHPVPINTTRYWTQHKTSLRDPYNRRRTSIPNADDVIVQNERRHIMETCTGNLAIKMKASWVTPPLNSGCLPGIERQRLILDGTLVEQTVTVQDLRRANEIAVINSLRGWRAADIPVGF